MLTSDGSSPSSSAACSASASRRLRAVEVVDISQPLAELEDDAVVDRHRRLELELACALRCRGVEAVAREQVGSHEARERERADPCVRARSFEHLDRVARSRGGGLDVDRRRPYGEGRLAVRSQDRIAGGGECSPGDRACFGLAGPAIGEVGETEQRTREQIGVGRRAREILEQGGRPLELPDKLEARRQLEAPSLHGDAFQPASAAAQARSAQRQYREPRAHEHLRLPAPRRQPRLRRGRGSKREVARSFLRIAHHLRERAVGRSSSCKRRRGVNGRRIQGVREHDPPVGRDVDQARFLTRLERSRIEQPHIGSSGCGGAQQCLAAFGGK